MQYPGLPTRGPGLGTKVGLNRDIYTGKTDWENKMYFLNLLLSGLIVVQFYGEIVLHSLHTSSEDLCQIGPLS